MICGTLFELLKMRSLLLLSAFTVLAYVHMSQASALHFDQSSNYEQRQPATQVAFGAKETEDDDDDGDEIAQSAEPCCLPYVWQSKVIIWTGAQRSSFNVYFDYPGGRTATYTADYGSITKQADDGEHVNLYVFNKTHCVIKRFNATMQPSCIPKSSEHIGTFKLGPSVIGHHWLTTQAWSIYKGEETITVRDADCAPVEASLDTRPGMLSEYYTDVRTHIEDHSVFDPPQSCCRPLNANVGKKELEEMKLSGRSILTKFGLEQ